ncbi:PulJ/GspJ family protein [Achromobacter aloeverae]|uniref:General secretion pathway protein GspJ n=1 Tax=Achromobacter aloeverae TaxID=1750518 RepID=A0A4Q1HDA1_9BURK|nr:prepilin-type N-terminal cleavage/methylation domain-containing protein [Achromobacter aloeverae]RXN83879.1 general secretion pathway protein GspJ [Achromobacter aloeverae]
MKQGADHAGIGVRTRTGTLDRARNRPLQRTMGRPSTPPHTPAGGAGDQAGFTLIEVLVAITLMALVSLLAWRGISRVADTRAWLERDAADNAVVVRTLGQLERDLTLSDDGHNSDDAARPGLPVGGVAVAQEPGKPLQLEIVRASPAGDGAWQAVIWRIRNGALWRYTGAAGLRYPLPPAQAGAEVMAGVAALGVRFWIPGQGWVLPGTAGVGKASGVEIAVERNHDGQRERYTRVVVLR